MYVAATPTQATRTPRCNRVLRIRHVSLQYLWWEGLGHKTRSADRVPGAGDNYIKGHKVSRITDLWTSIILEVGYHVLMLVKQDNL